MFILFCYFNSNFTYSVLHTTITPSQLYLVFGMFKIKNHGVSETTVNKMLTVAREFFHQPEGERMKHYSADSTKTTRVSTSFNVSADKILNWRDYLRLHCFPIQDFINEWPENPVSFKEITAEYATSVRALVLRLLEAISESLGLERDHISNRLGTHAQHMAFNYYPPCPEPELTYGLPGHKDPTAITVLLQDQVSGLQVFKDDKWVSVYPIPNTFFVNIGDQMQVRSIYNPLFSHSSVLNCVVLSSPSRS